MVQTIRRGEPATPILEHVGTLARDEGALIDGAAAFDDRSAIVQRREPVIAACDVTRYATPPGNVTPGCSNAGGDATRRPRHRRSFAIPPRRRSPGRQRGSARVRRARSRRPGCRADTRRERATPRAPFGDWYIERRPLRPRMRRARRPTCWRRPTLLPPRCGRHSLGKCCPTIGHAARVARIPSSQPPPTRTPRAARAARRILASRAP